MPRDFARCDLVPVIGQGLNDVSYRGVAGEGKSIASTTLRVTRDLGDYECEPSLMSCVS